MRSLTGFTATVSSVCFQIRLGLASGLLQLLVNNILPLLLLFGKYTPVSHQPLQYKFCVFYLLFRLHFVKRTCLKLACCQVAALGYSSQLTLFRKLFSSFSYFCLQIYCQMYIFLHIKRTFKSIFIIMQLLFSLDLGLQILGNL